MKFKYLKTLLLLFAVASKSLLAQKSPTKAVAVVNIVIEDTAMLRNATIKFSLCKNHINTSSAPDKISFSKKINSKKTNIIVNLEGSYNYGNIEYTFDGDKWKSPLIVTNNMFLFNNGDNVTLHLSYRRKGAWFTGVGADKYNCMYRLHNSEITSFNESNSLYGQGKYQEAFNTQRLQRDSLYKENCKILKEYKQRIEPGIWQLISLDNWATYQRSLVEICCDNIFKARSLSKAYIQISEVFFFKAFGHYKETFEGLPSLFAFSYYYADFILAKEEGVIIISNSSPGKSYYHDLKLVDILKAIDVNYEKGSLKDKLKLLSFYSMNRKRQQDFDILLDEAVEKAANSPYKSALLKFRSHNLTGVKAYDFALEDEHGEVKSLADFKGKMIIMDFWFTGCKACTGMANTLRKITSLYSSNPKIVFITVSIDGNERKSLWKASLNTEAYTTKEDINLLAGEAAQSAIIKHYNINSYPTLIAISKVGRIISTAPPDPRLDEQLFVDFLQKNL